MKNKIVSLLLFIIISIGLLPNGVCTAAEAAEVEYINLQDVFAAENTQVNAYVVPANYAGAAIENADLQEISLYRATSEVGASGKFCIQIPQKYENEKIYLVCDDQSALRCLNRYNKQSVKDIKVSENGIRVSGTAENVTGYVAVFVLKSGKDYKDLANNDLSAVKSMNTAPISNGKFTSLINDCTVDNGDRLLVSFGDEFVILKISDISESVDFYVSENGNDSNSGDISSPLKTLEKARELAQGVNKDSTKVNVFINSGEYNISDFKLTEKDSGSENYLVTYRGIGNERPVLKNTKEIDTSLFENLSQEEAELIRQDAKSKVKKVDLFSQGFTADDFKPDSKYGQEIYFNGVKQELAGWPNDGYVLIDDIKVPQTETQNLVFAFYNKELKRWKNAKYPIIEGYMGAEYEKQRVRAGKINPDDFTIAYAENAYYGGKKGYRFRITNLLEELDMPGEYYLDRDNLVLYYYPYDSFKLGDKLEVSLPSTSVLTLTNVSNVKISGISITQNNATGITFNDCSHLTIEDCYIGKLGGKGIFGSGTNIDINRNTISNVTSRGIDFDRGGNRNTLTENNVKIRNNHIYNTGFGGIMVGKNTVGTKIINNVIHKTGYYPIRYGGNKTYIAYNEIYNANRELGDAWAIYSGRDLSEYGNEMSYNYVHHAGSLDKRIYASNGISSGDDWESGTIIKNNIVFMDSKINTVAIGTHTRDNTIQYNIAVGADAGLSFVDRYLWSNNFNNGAQSEVLNTLTRSAGLQSGYAETEIWKKEYPQISTIYQDIVDNDGRFITRNNVVTDNVLVDAPLKYYNTHPACDHSEMFRKYSTIKDNYETDSYDIFVDSENHDFRITNAAMKQYNLNENIINESNFDMEMIGISGEAKVFDKDFLITYPQNGSTLSSDSEMVLRWQDTGFADSYTYQIATDENFSNIVAEDTVYVDYAKINVKRNQNYYWRVTAHNTSKEFGGLSWQNANGIYSFSVNDKQVTVNNVRITESQGSKNADVYLTNNSTEDLSCKVVFAEYEENGKLKDVRLFDETVRADDVNKLHSFTLWSPSLKDYSVFVWNMNQKPLSAVYKGKTLGDVEANKVILTTKSAGYTENGGAWTDGSAQNQRIGTAENGNAFASFEYRVDSPGYYNVYYKVDTLTDGAESAQIYAENGGGVSESESESTTVNFKTQSGYVYLGKIIAVDAAGKGYIKVCISAKSGKISASEIVLEEVIE